MKQITIAIDGFSSTGKSTIAKLIAKSLGYIYVDSGAMYRAITFFAMKNGLISTEHFNRETLISELPNAKVSFTFNDALGFAEVYLNNENIEKDIRTLEVSNLVSIVAAVPEVRAQLVKIQKAIGKHKAVVMDGRDIGTVVFPDAELKIFMTASAETRALRRYNELKNNGENITFEAVFENVQKRDHLDSTREDSPLIQAEDAIAIDNSNATIEEQYQNILKLANTIIAS
ncbi:(d)CMP kinase [Formosa algae]|uniref:Cytidylate kinase n=1 Tax=Formosa algae TaxID=225843 RepID=A0A9X0YLU2_9FLAO|nr:(d)CMP kinase [Formosa algae]MBP1841147.1 cytidylate kinase [Formosa algae]MDQ0336433.1 cytidylate kinase [Formosa algae]OEI81396.1 cytidylate kinase [Formosa algae]PNW27931.1 cytidylate kinase [Formosa algae]